MRGLVVLIPMLVGLVPLSILMLLGAARYVTPYGWGYVLGLVLIVSGITLSWGQTGSRGRVLWASGLLLLLLIVALRVRLAGQSEQIGMMTLPGKSSVSWLNLVFDEQDVALVGAQVLAPLGGISPSERRAIPTLHQLYQVMRTEQQVIPSAFARTYLGQERPQAFDLLLLEPEAQNPTVGVIFLHGFAGNFSLLCWLVAGAAREVGALTACPSVGWQGDWWAPVGAATVQESIAYLRARGVTRLYLAGLSNGGVGASTLAEGLEADLAGLILISGLNPSATISDLPTLVIHSRGDERIGYAVAERFSERGGPGVELVSFEGDHFLLATHTEEVRAAIVAWLVEQGETR